MKKASDSHERPIDAAVGRRIRLRRRLLKVSLQTLAGEIGISYQQLLKCESGENRVSAGRLWRIAKVLGVPITYFYEDLQADPLPAPDPSSSVAGKTSPFGDRMLDALGEIADPQLRKRLMDLVEGLAAASRARPPRKS
jgi:transcriptional regulator with XRE-family HTH domain